MRQRIDQRRVQWFQQKLLTWYAAHKRDLPWRRTHDPYRILVSEVMLQQTQVDRVISKYHAFLKEFPTVRALAKASPAAVIRAWSGLGYNRRALYLHRCARIIVKDYHGTFPRDPEVLETLPGVGKYTARAIVCFAWKKDIATADVNILRVLHRWIYGVHGVQSRTKELWQAAETMLPIGDGYVWNHGLMDFGALVCTAKRPKCGECPMRSRCAAYPKILSVDWSRVSKKVTPFKDSDRYYRGRIIEYLREAPRHRVTIAALEHHFRSTCPPTRVQILVETLVKDGLVVTQRNEISLPR